MLCSPVKLVTSRCCRNKSPFVRLWLTLCRRCSAVLWASHALLTVSADLSASADPRPSVSVRLLGVAVGVLNANEPRGTRGGDEAFVVGTLGGEKSLQSSTSPAPIHQPPAPSPSATLYKFCNDWPMCFLYKRLPNGSITHYCHWPIRSPSIKFPLSRYPSRNIFLYPPEKPLLFNPGLRKNQHPLGPIH